MRCQEVCQQLGFYRELARSELDQLQRHVATCPGCAAAWAAYQTQDRVLSALPVINPSPKLAAAVRARATGQRRAAQRPVWRWATIVALSLFLFLVLTGGIIRAATNALPGDALYPIKRTAEQVHLMLIPDPVARERYQHQLTETRREEIGDIIRLRRQARVQFHGRLEAVADDVWVVNGLAVVVDPIVWPSAPPPPGSVVSVEAQAVAGQLAAHRIQVE